MHLIHSNQKSRFHRRIGKYNCTGYSQSTLLLKFELQNCRLGPNRRSALQLQSSQNHINWAESVTREKLLDICIGSLLYKLLKTRVNNERIGKKFTPSPLVWGQSLQALQVIHNMSLPVSICTLYSFGGEPNFTFVKYSLQQNQYGNNWRWTKAINFIYNTGQIRKMLNLSHRKKKTENQLNATTHTQKIQSTLKPRSNSKMPNLVNTFQLNLYIIHQKNIIFIFIFPSNIHL